MNAPATFHPVEFRAVGEYAERCRLVAKLLFESVRELRIGNVRLADERRQDARTLFDGLGVLVLEMQQQENPDDELVCGVCGTLWCEQQHGEERS